MRCAWNMVICRVFGLAEAQQRLRTPPAAHIELGPYGPPPRHMAIQERSEVRIVIGYKEMPSALLWCDFWFTAPPMKNRPKEGERQVRLMSKINYDYLANTTLRAAHDTQEVLAAVAYATDISLLFDWCWKNNSRFPISEGSTRASLYQSQKWFKARATGSCVSFRSPRQREDST